MISLIQNSKRVAKGKGKRISLPLMHQNNGIYRTGKWEGGTKLHECAGKWVATSL